MPDTEAPILSDSQLTPNQRRAFDGVSAALEKTNIVALAGNGGSGRTTVLRALHRRHGGVFLDLQPFLSAVSSRHPQALEESLFDVLWTAIRDNPLVFVDDFDVATSVMSGGCHFYPRSGFLGTPMNVLATFVAEQPRKLVLATDGGIPDALSDRGEQVGVDICTPDDYAALAGNWLPPELLSRVNFRRVHRFAARLDGHQIRSACRALQDHAGLDTEAFIEHLRSQQLVSNVDLGEVVDVDFDELHGVEDVLRSLDKHIVLPLENADLAEKLGLQPKRGVLLVGPPGTGKTTIGKALAHRLRGKFFLIDGTAISGTDHFYHQVHRVFAAASENAPSVIFIDDSDVIFESGREHGLYRYLLTMLDGLEGRSAGRVCVMMTAMDVGNMPPALVRSGRIELWLEMTLPDAVAREAILAQHFERLPDVLQGGDAAHLAGLTDGFSGADLKRLVEDGKVLYASDYVNGLAARTATEYFAEAAQEVRSNRERYASAFARANQERPARPAWFNPNLWSQEE